LSKILIKEKNMEIILDIIEIIILVGLIYRKDVKDNGLQKEKEEDKVNLLNSWFYGVKHR